MKNYRLHIVHFAAAALLALAACTTLPVQPQALPHEGLSVRVSGGISPISATIAWSTPATVSNIYQIALGGKTIASDTVPRADTQATFTDTTLIPGSSNLFSVYRMYDGGRYDSGSVTVTCPDTSRSNLSFTTYHIGLAGAVLYGICSPTNNPNDIFACGGGGLDSGSKFIPWTFLHYINGQIYYYFCLIGGGINACNGISDSSVNFVGAQCIAQFDGQQFTYHVFNGDVFHCVQRFMIAGRRQTETFM